MSALLEVAGISVAFDGFKAINNLSFSIAEKELRAVIGPDGAEVPAGPIGRLAVRGPTGCRSFLTSTIAPIPGPRPRSRPRCCRS